MNLNTIFNFCRKISNNLYCSYVESQGFCLGFFASQLLIIITTPNYNLEWSIKVTPENTTTFGLDEPQNNIIKMTAIFLQSIGVMKI